MSKLMTGPGCLRSNDGEMMMRSTMGLAAQALDERHDLALRITLKDILPAGSEMEVTLAPEQAADFASELYALAKAAVAKSEGAPSVAPAHTPA